MAKKPKEAAAEGEEDGKKKKPIKLILIVVVLAVVGVKMFVLKDPVQTPAQLAAAVKVKEQALYDQCAIANDLPTTGDIVIGGAKDATTETTTAHAKKAGAKEAGKELTKVKETTTTGAAEKATVAPVKPPEGPILPADQSVMVNLQDGNFLKLGIAVVLPAGAVAKVAKEEGLVAKATALALQAVARHNVEDLYSPDTRDKIQKELSFETCQETEAKIMSILFIEFTFQKV